ncbi:MAG: hypothetical protein QM398_01090 [Thermoproteota archaeon]|nr:hypothetical protein [Thermoproteota archaeon]NLD67157.1 hypothetical protein [Thermoproteota archaeon]
MRTLIEKYLGLILINTLVLVTVVNSFATATDSLQDNAQSLPNDEELKDRTPQKSPFDPSKIRRLDESSEFAEKHELGRAKQQNSPKYSPKTFSSTSAPNIQGTERITDYSEHCHWGTGIRASWEITGVYARHQISGSLIFSDSDHLLYAPTLKSPEPCPLEVGVKYTSTTPLLFVYDHYNGEFTDVDYTYSELNTEGYLSNDYYDVTIIWYDNTWGAYLYNYPADTWDRIYKQPNNGYIDNDFGWDIYEAYYSGDWPDTNYLKASEIMYYAESSWDYVWGWWIFGPGYETYNWPNGFGVPHNWISDYYSWWAGVTSFYPSSINWTYTVTYGGGELYDAENILGQYTDDNYATLIDMYSGSSSRIVAQMNDDSTGSILVNSYSESGYHGPLYVYVSASPSGGWTQVGSPLGIGHTSPSWDYIGYYSGQFRYIAICGYNPGGNPVRLHVDAINVNPG